MAILLTGAGMFGVFLFLTYYLQQNLQFTAVQSGLAFLPMTAALMTGAQLGTIVLAPRVGPRFIIAPGLLLGALGMGMLTGIDLDSTYLSTVLPATLVFGAGVGLVFSSAMNLATAGVAPEDAGAASATVSTAQQVGGSIGTALLSTLAASAATSYATSHTPTADLVVQAALHSYTTAFTFSAGILLTAAVITALVLPGTVRRPAPDEAEVVAVGG